jgi:hypothetical protein
MMSEAEPVFIGLGAAKIFAPSYRDERKPQQ